MFNVLDAAVEGSLDLVKSHRTRFITDTCQYLQRFGLMSTMQRQ